MEQLNNVDVIFLVIIGISALVGIARGMTKELLSIIGWIFGAAALFYLVPMIIPFMETYVSSKLLAGVVSAMAILLIFCILWILTVDKMSAAVRSSKLSSLDRILGFVFGAARGALIVILLVVMISKLIPDDSQKGMFAESVLYEKANGCVEPLKEMIPESLIAEVKRQSEQFSFIKDSLPAAKDKQEKAENDVESDADNNKSGENNNADTDKEDAKSEDKTNGNLKDTLKNIDENLDVMKKGGETLFKQLAQPKTDKGDKQSKEAEVDDLVSDLDKLLDVLDDKMVKTEEAPTENKKK